MKTKEFELTVKFKVNLDALDELSATKIKVTKRDMIEMAQEAFNDYFSNMCQEITGAGDWNVVAEVVASTYPQFKIK